MTFVLVQATHDRAAVGRGIAVSIAGTLIGCVLVVSRLGPGVATAPLVIESGNDHRLVIPGDAYGSCYVAARVNGVLFNHMLLDTGASGRMVFGSNHAAQLGYDPAELLYSQRYSSANGYGREAVIRLREFRLGSFVIHDVRASITEAPQDSVLIGVDILHHLNLRLSGGNCELRMP